MPNQRIHRTGKQQWFSKNVYLIHRRVAAGDAFRYAQMSTYVEE